MTPDIQGMEWELEFLPHFRREWEPGQHIAIIAPTHQGKTTVLVSILNDSRRKFALAYDPKGGDSTLAGLGWPRVPAHPRQRPWWKVWDTDPYDRMARGEPFRAVVGPVATTRSARERLREVYRDSLGRVYDDGGWTVAIDEFQILSDKRMMDLGTEVETLLIAARDKGVSVITLFQAPRWVPRAASDQCEWIFVALTRDRDVIERLAEILGRSRAEVEGAIQGLGSRPYSWLIARNNPREPLIVTRPPRVARKVAA